MKCHGHSLFLSLSISLINSNKPNANYVDAIWLLTWLSWRTDQSEKKIANHMRFSTILWHLQKQKRNISTFMCKKLLFYLCWKFCYSFASWRWCWLGQMEKFTTYIIFSSQIRCFNHGIVVENNVKRIGGEILCHISL